MFESQGEFSVPIEFSHSANLQKVSVVLQTQSHYENRPRSSKQHLSSVSLGILVGPRILQKKGWKWSVMLVPAFGSLAIFVLCFGPLMWGHSLSQAILKGIEYAWVVPLVQIAFLWYPQKDRFLVQASVCLVISPLFEWGAGFLNFGSFVSLTISFAILGLMSVCALNCARMRE